MALIDGVPIFIGLMSLTNDKGELRGVYLVASKAQSQFASALDGISKSLTLYGHSQPQLMFTDNLDDTPFLTRHFPSLSQDVVPVDERTQLPRYVLPDHVIVSVISPQAAHVDKAVATIIDELDAEDPNQYLVIGLDTEWNVNIGSTNRSSTAIVQIALPNRVFIFQVSLHLF